MVSFKPTDNWEVSFRMYRQVLNWETSLFLRFLGQPTEASDVRHGWTSPTWLAVTHWPGHLTAIIVLLWEMHSRLGLAILRPPPSSQGGPLLPCKKEVQSLYYRLVVRGEREWDIYRTFPKLGSDLFIFTSLLFSYKLPLNLVLKALNKTMHAVLCAFPYQ